MRRREALLPWYGYAIINVVVWILVGAIYLVSKRGVLSAVSGNVDRPGVAPLLLFIPVAVLVASVYDFFYDRISGRRAARASVAPASDQQ